MKYFSMVKRILLTLPHCRKSRRTDPWLLIGQQKIKPANNLNIFSPFLNSVIQIFVFIICNYLYQLSCRSMRRIISRNPFTRKINAEIEFLSNQELENKITTAHSAYLIHSKRKIQERADLIASLGNSFDKNKKQLSELITQQMGKPIKQSQAQVDKTISFCRHYSKHYNEILPTQIKSDAKVKTLVKYLPMGIVYSVVPFNFPFYLIFKGGLPNLLLGNVLLSRTADSTPLLGDKVQQVVRSAGYDSGQFQNVFTKNDQLQLILKNPKVIGVSFTGSSKAGAAISEVAGRHLKKSVMELGGNDPFVVLSDADLDLAVDNAVKSRTVNAGQVCFSPKRFIIVQQVYERFRDKLIERLKLLKYGNPKQADTQMGPLARQDLYDNLKAQLDKIPSSWKVFWQRQKIDRPFYPITVIQASSTQVYDEEFFGPIFTLFRAENEQHAVVIANSSQYGLGASVHSRSRGQQVLDQVNAGMGFVNSFVKSDYLYPSGGVGKSGYGRECGVQGYRSFANIRTHYVN